MEESGLSEGRITSELARTTGQLRLFADVVLEGSWLGARVDPALPERTPLPRPDIRQRQVPIGPVAVFGASNFPLAFSVAGGDTGTSGRSVCGIVFSLAHVTVDEGREQCSTLTKKQEYTGIPDE